MPRLALNGAKPVLQKPITMRWPLFDDDDEQALLRAFRSGQWWRGGDMKSQAASEVGRFERDFAKLHDAKYALAVNSGTTAVEVALRAVGVKPGDEVIAPDISFVVTASACLPLGAYPVFVDVDPLTAQIDPDALEAAITPRTVAVCLVHFGGYPADMDRITRIVRKHRLALVEDCAHAHGTQWRGQGVGTFGDFGTFSFQQFKALPAGEGGMLLTNSQKHWQSAYRFHNLGRLEDQGLYSFFLMSSNLRLTNLQGALLNSQFVKFRKQLRQRMRTAKRLGRQLRQIGGVEPLPDDERITRRGYYYYLFRYDSAQFKGLPRDRFLEALRAEGVTVAGKAYGSALHTYPLFQEMQVPADHPACQYRRVSCPVSERLATQELCSLHHSALLSDDQTIDRIAEAVQKIRDNVDELIASSPAASRQRAKGAGRRKLVGGRA